MQGGTEIPGMSENPDLPGAEVHRWDQILDKNAIEQLFPLLLSCPEPEILFLQDGSYRHLLWLLLQSIFLSVLII